MHATFPLLQVSDFPPIRRDAVTTLQVNLGYRCNQSCVHCHVNAGPNRTEMMDDATLALISDVLRARRITTLDLTGGAPELHPRFRELVRRARDQGVRVHSARPGPGSAGTVPARQRGRDRRLAALLFD